MMYKKLSQIRDRLQKVLRTVSALQENVKDSCQLEDEDTQLFVRRCGFELREVAILLYKRSTEMLTDGLTESDVTHLYERQLCPFDRVAVYLERDAIRVRLPMLGSRQSRNQPVAKDAMFADSVRYAFRSASNYHEYDFSTYQNKIITFTFVYGHVAAQRGWISDSDNHEIKYVLDAIASVLPGGDTPLSTSIVLTTLVSDVLEEGTYICISSADAGLPTATEQMRYWVKTEYHATDGNWIAPEKARENAGKENCQHFRDSGHTKRKKNIGYWDTHLTRKPVEWRGE